MTEQDEHILRMGLPSQQAVRNIRQRHRKGHQLFTTLISYSTSLTASMCIRRELIVLSMIALSLVSYVRFWTILNGFPDNCFSVRPSTLISSQHGNRTTNFTVVTQIFTRSTLSDVQNFLDMVCDFDGVGEILISWNSYSPAPPLQALRCPVPVRLWEMGTNSMNNRFAVASKAHYEAILLLDDDLVVAQDDVKFAFRVWQENSQSIVGFLIRDFRHDDENVFHYISQVDYEKGYTMVLIGASFFSRHYAERYSGNDAASVALRNIVDELHNCDDIAMNCMVASATEMPPIHVTGLVYSIQRPASPGLSEDVSWYTHRNQCLQMIASIYGGSLPLLRTFSSVSKPTEHYKIVRGFHGMDMEPSLVSPSYECVTAVLITMHRHGNIKHIVEDILGKSLHVCSVIVMNNDRGIKHNMETLGIPSNHRQRVRIINVDSNDDIFTFSRYLGCLESSTSLCYFQDDDYRALYVDRLVEVYHLANPRTVVVTDLATAYLNTVRSVHVEQTHAGFAWLGCGSVTSRHMVNKFVDFMLLNGTKEMRRLADAYYTLWTGEVPLSLEARLSTSGLDTGQPYSCKNCTEQRAENQFHVSKAIALANNRTLVSNNKIHLAKCIYNLFEEPAIFFSTIDLVRERIQSQSNYIGVAKKGWRTTFDKKTFRFCEIFTDQGWESGRAFSGNDFLQIDLPSPVFIDGLDFYFSNEAFVQILVTDDGEKWKKTHKSIVNGSEMIRHGCARAKSIRIEIESNDSLTLSRLNVSQC